MMINTTRKLSFILMFSLVILVNASDASAQSKGIKVIANIEPAPGELNKQEVRNLFMGGTSKLDLQPVALQPNNETRVMFNTLVVGLSEVRVQSYWAQMRFSGRMKPPKALSSEQEVIDYITKNKGVIAYVSSDAKIPDELHVLLEVSP